MLRQLLNDEAGFIVSAELVLIATILVLGLIVGMSQIQYAVVEEMNDVAHAIGALNQSYLVTGFAAVKQDGTTLKSAVVGSSFKDAADECDTCELVTCDAAAECDDFPTP